MKITKILGFVLAVIFVLAAAGCGPAKTAVPTTVSATLAPKAFGRPPAPPIVHIQT